MWYKENPGMRKSDPNLSESTFDSRKPRKGKTMAARIARLFLCALALVIVTSCADRRPLRAPDPTEVQLFTGGIVSRHAVLRVTFTHAMIESEPGQPLSISPFSFSPRLSGTSRWADERTLEFAPNRPLLAGRRFRASVDLPNTRGFDFPFVVESPRLNIVFSGLSTAGVNADLYELSGSVKTTDVEEAAAMEKTVRSSLKGKELPVEWVHGPDPLIHEFRIRDIERGEKPEMLEVRWSGRQIGNRSSGRKTFPVPARRSFEVVDIRPMDEGERFIEVGFSDPLPQAQDLRGLIRVKGIEDLRFAVSANRVRLYSSSPWKATESVMIEPGVKSGSGGSLAVQVARTVSFKDQLPAVRFAGNGVILPTTQGLTVPIETMNLNAVIVEAFQIFGDNMPQFLQINALSGTEEMFRVGKVVWRNVVPLGFSDDQKNAWIRHGLDISALVKDHPDGMFQLRVSFRRPHAVWNCEAPADEEPRDWSKTPLIDDGPRWDQPSNWDWFSPEWNEDAYENRDNPCHPAYYLRWYHGERVLAVRNVLVSNIGLLAKGETSGTMHVLCSDLRTALPLAGVKIALVGYQRQQIASGLSDKDGAVSFRGIDRPAFVIAERQGQQGYLRVDPPSALVTSHFDVAGEAVSSGVKGFLYGERGVWRPGDPLYLNFILSDPEKAIPANHPVTMELRDPRGKLGVRLTRTSSVDGFYSFQTQTDVSAPTGNWEARVKVGDRVFGKTIKIESVMPNRLKIGFDVPETPMGLSRGSFTGVIQSSWLHGAPASNLKADIRLRLTQTATTFSGFEDYSFDDPTREFAVSDQTLFEGALDSKGRASVSSSIGVEDLAPGKLQASFTVRVFEPGGAFSTEQFSRSLNPYDRYVGVRVPKGDAARGMLLTDTDHSVRIVLLDPVGNPVKSASVLAEIYKLNWRWWWEKGEEDLAEFAESRSFKALKSDRVSISNGAGEWKFRINYPEWGRYFIRMRDQSGGHSTGRIVYIDWPGWAGRGMEGKAGASMLTLTSDKPKYAAGERVIVSFPSNPQGRALVSLEKGGRVMKREWVAPAEGTTRYQFTATPDMAPNIYVHVTFLQPHLQTANDLPIRLYGVTPVMVEDPSTHLKPVIRSAEVFTPGQKANVTVTEAEGRPMTYTLAVVDEGLLRINRYKAPDPWDVFYKREASFLNTWDVYDFVAGAFAGKLESLLAIGGGDDESAGGERKASRFPPLVRFVGPVTLAKGASNTHAIDIPQYIGAVRVMAVAGHAGAYGASEKEVAVKSDLMLLPTLPRVLSTGERVELPVSVFNANENLKSVSLAVEVRGPISVSGSPMKTVTFSGPEEKTARFTLEVGNRAGIAKVRVTAEGGGFKTAQEIEVDVRIPVTRQTKVIGLSIAAGGRWQEGVDFPGIAGTNTMQLEVSRFPPMDLGRNLDYLIRYPHGCVEQTTSQVFPQLSLDKLVKLSPTKADEVQRHIEAGIRRLGYFQTQAGGFAFWPGMGESDEWSTSYAGNFLLEAGKRGFALPPEILSRWTEYQKLRVDAWMPGDERGNLQQAYRLYTLALAGSPSLPAMNRLRENSVLSPVAQWRLAAAYFLAGQREEARKMARGLSFSVTSYRELSGTYGSDLRDKAMILEALVIMGMMEQAESLAVQVSRQLTEGGIYGTQTTAFALLALSQFALGGPENKALKFSCSWAEGPAKEISSTAPIVTEEVPVADAVKGMLSITNSSAMTVYPRLILQGTPPMGSETASKNGLSMTVIYWDDEGNQVDPASAIPGKEMAVSIAVTNDSKSVALEQVALTYLIPGGWEVANTRIQETEEKEIRNFNYQDIRDDRVLTYFAIKPRATEVFTFRVTPAYAGRFYIPPVTVEAMYDPTINARVPGRWLGDK